MVGDVVLFILSHLSRVLPGIRPTGKQRSKIFCQARQMQWNKLVDEYIRTSGDKRAKIEIERVAKLGSSLGALHQICEGENCEIMAGREVGRLRTCSGCKMV